MLAAVFGGRGQGKTRLLIETSYYLSGQGTPTLCFDPMANWPSQYVRSLDDARTHALSVFRLETPEEIADAALEMQNCAAIFDESDLLCDSASWKSEAAYDIALRGRHYKVGLILATQRPRNMHGDVKSLADRVACFALPHPKDVEVIDQWLGPEYGELVRRLPPHFFVLWPDRLLCRLGEAPRDMKQVSFGGSNGTR